MSKNEIIIGIAPGVQIILREDCSVSWRGGAPDEVLQLAEVALRNLERWMRLMEQKIGEEESAAAIEKAVDSRMAKARDLPDFAREPVESLIREQERKKRQGE